MARRRRPDRAPAGPVVPREYRRFSYHGRDEAGLTAAWAAYQRGRTAWFLAHGLATQAERSRAIWESYRAERDAA